MSEAGSPPIRTGRIARLECREETHNAQHACMRTKSQWQKDPSFTRSRGGNGFR